MEIWAAIDLHLGRAVTLAQGEMNRVTTWKDDPRDAAKRWANEGAHGLHIIDLDAVFDNGSNLDIVRDIVRQSEIPVQLGGGIRNELDAESRLKMGASRVILGTLAFREPGTLSKLLGTYGPERIMVAADYKDGVLVTKGWRESEGVPIVEAMRRFKRLGVDTALVTSVRKDGTAGGPDLETIGRICASTTLKILCSGGIRNVSDVEELRRVGAHGVILGKALYQGTIRLADCRGMLH